MYYFTDLALEARELASANNNEIEGVEAKDYEIDGVTIHAIEICTQEGSETMGKPRGNYVTLDIPKDYGLSSSEFETCVKALHHVLCEMCENMTKVLVIGLGNEGVTPDALGPLAVKSLFVTRHIQKLNKNVYEQLGVNNMSALAPGVMGQTGIETAEIVKGVINKVNPSCVVVIDALAARSLARLATTVQVSDTGINPGSGIGNSRAELSKNTLGVPVISVGMPTVVNGATLTADVASLVSDTDRTELYHKAKKAIMPYETDLVVTPKEIDTIVSDGAKLIAYAINMAVHQLDYKAMRELL